MNQDNLNYKGGGIWSYKNSKGFPETTNQVFPLLPPDGFLRQKMPGVDEIIVPRTGNRIINDLIQKKKKTENVENVGNRGGLSVVTNYTPQELQQEVKSFMLVGTN
jgi:hypothetical protein